MKKVLIAPDKFKGSISARAVCQVIAAGIKQHTRSVKFTFHPMADGGDDSLNILASHLALRAESVKTQDPLGRPMDAQYFTSTDAAFIEVASASGLVLLNESERNPLETSTLGTGKMLLDALSKGYQKIYLFLGGSATNDAGMGIAHALGFRFLDADSQVLQPIGKNLEKVNSIVNQVLFDFSKIEITLFYDVTNPLFGQNGAAHVYASQKGATAEQIQFLDKGLTHFSKIIQQHTEIDVATIPGGGAAGGIGAGLLALCGAQMDQGFDIISKLTKLEEKIQAADWVISGEGKLDEQSLQGKVIDGIAKLCKKHHKPLILFVGKNDLDEATWKALNIQQVHSISDRADSHEDAMLNGLFYLEALARDFRFS